MELSEKQRECIAFCLDKSRRLVAVTGEAGTGKTTLIKLLAEQLDNLDVPYVVASPTGKAAKRVKEATGVNAITVHKLLEYGRPNERDEKTGKALDPTYPSRSRHNPLTQTTVIVDEYSMINHELNRNLIDALPRGGRLIMFGDVSQLPPIEPYQVLNAPDTPFVSHLKRENAAFVLTEVFRQAEGSDVLTAAHAVRKGNMPPRAENFIMKVTTEPVAELRKLVTELRDSGIDFGKIENQILTPMRKSWIGTNALNGMLRAKLNPTVTDEISLVRHKWDEERPLSVGIGDKVVCTENTYDMRNFEDRFAEWDEDTGRPITSSFIGVPENQMMLNGETGIVHATYPDGSLEIDFGDRLVEIPYTYAEYWAKRDTIIDVYPSKAIDLAYALTTHKAQGSEYKNVIYVANKSAQFLLCRENLYTGITRARDSVHLVTDQTALVKLVRTSHEDIERRRNRKKQTKRSTIK